MAEKRKRPSHKSSNQKENKKGKASCSKQRKIDNFFDCTSNIDKDISTLDDVPDKNEEEKPSFADSMYTDEVNIMLATVLKSESHLFTSTELERIESFKSLEREPKHLFVRLWMRKHRFIRLDKVDYTAHIQDIKASADELCKQGMAQPITNYVEALSVLTREEISTLVKTMQIPVKGKTKMQYMDAVLRYAETNQAKMSRCVLDLAGQCIILDVDMRCLFQRIHLVYYRTTDPEASTKVMSSAILARLSRRNFPDYTVERTNYVWKSRQDLLAYEEALDLHRRFDEQVAKATSEKQADVSQSLVECWTLCENIIGVWEDGLQKEQEERPYYMRRFEANWVYTHLIEQGTKILGKLHEYELEALILRKLLSQKTYQLGKRGRWYDRLALVQMTHIAANKSNNPRSIKKLALQTCIEAIQDPTVHQSERISDAVVGKKSVWRATDGAECSVEELALEHYARKGYRGLHSEGGIVSMLFALLFWDILFAPVPGVFETPYQSAPLDFGSDGFYIGRKTLITARLDEICQGQSRKILEQVDERERPRQTICTGVHWNYEREDLINVAECIGPLPLSSLCKLLAEEFGHGHGGLPDLCCWNEAEKQCMFVEGPGDKLSETQKLWIDTLTEIDIPVEVCYVKLWQDEKTLAEQSKTNNS
ncbi:hypothetical protein EC973_007190 [Apophysomyces ossiformis]|uniref:Fanconi-associated nuclease n=1 Tax=Apophysomyces ossiformis TaxID=679940 RepID=A0A8H7BUI8_9FUNG|nr:hypothetical protein EC973_007190 [Apophysomyces ossiformis]